MSPHEKTLIKTSLFLGIGISTFKISTPFVPIIAFELIKYLRSGWRAFWYNNTASLFNMSLKLPFDPLTSEEDYLIEDILQRQFQSGRLEYQKAYDEFDIYELSEQWKN